MIRCLAVDDEMLALDLIEDNIRKIPYLQMVKKCQSAFEAIEILRQQQIDLLFLDIQMPDLNGIQLLKSLQEKPIVIFTTAFSNYAIESYDLDVMDYLLKPYTFERFLRAVNKALEYLELKEKYLQSGSQKEPVASANFLFVRSGYKLVKIDVKNIEYIEGLGDYVKIYSGGSPILTQTSMKSMEEKLVSPDFIRVHRSFIISFNKIDFIRKNMVGIKGKEIPISDHYREQLFNIINHDKIVE
ncbi:MAG: LytTR family DNA-binding domain-containing protein [bacterium]